MECEAVVFDFDGTLVDSADCGVLATQEAFLQSGLASPAREIIESMMGIPIEASFLLMGAKGLSSKDLEVLLADFRSQYRDLESQHLKLFSGIRKLLESLEKKQIPIAVVSSKKTEVLERNCEMLGIGSFIQHHVGSNRVSKYKPDPEGVELVATALSIRQPDRMFVVGDAPVDIKMAKAAGAASFAAAWGASQVPALKAAKPDYWLKIPSDLLSYIPS